VWTKKWYILFNRFKPKTCNWRNDCISDPSHSINNYEMDVSSAAPCRRAEVSLAAVVRHYTTQTRTLYSSRARNSVYELAYNEENLNCTTVALCCSTVLPNPRRASPVVSVQQSVPALLPPRFRISECDVGKCFSNCVPRRQPWLCNEILNSDVLLFLWTRVLLEKPHSRS
jgi:hypothetical protein